VPADICPLLQWTQTQIDARLNGVLINWYDGSLGHKIGPHHDSTTNRVPGTPIVTISFGEARIFRLSQGTARRQDFVAESGDVYIMPWDTNLAWKHAVPHYKRYQGRRISVTMRAFVD
jgi:alkylated DNA repair dioxygenase AlkB